MSEWVGELKEALRTEFGDRPHTCALATVDKSGMPRVRTIVCRRIGDDGSLWFISDARSEKNEQLRGVAQAEVVFWLPSVSEQFRVAGAVRIASTKPPDPMRSEIWQSLSDSSRALFFWPGPGAKRIDPPEAFPQFVDPVTPPPASFEVLSLRPRRVEHLQLSSHPHRRRRWMLAGKWSAGAEINP